MASRLKGIAAAGLLAALLAGCATPPPPPPAVVTAPAGPCHDTPDLATALAIEAPDENRAERVSATFGPETACWAEAEAGHTPYALARLPEGRENMLLTVSAPRETHRMVALNVRTLDDTGQTVRRFDRDRYLSLGDGYSLQLTPRPEESLVLVTVDPELVGEQLETIELGITTQQVYTGYGTATTYHGQDIARSRGFSYEGTVSFQLLNAQ